MSRGIFITFEGGEGAGKSTQIERLAARLRQKRYDVVVTREPGGSPGAEAIRHVLLSGAAQPFGASMEAALFAAARADHVDRVIRPAVARGAVVLCDRFLDSTRVYQGATGRLDASLIKSLEAVAVDGTLPDLTLILDLDPTVGLMRAAARRGAAGADRFERESLSLHEERRQAFLDIAESEPDRCVVIDASMNAEAVEDRVTEAVFGALEQRARPRAGLR